MAHPVPAARRSPRRPRRQRLAAGAAAAAATVLAALWLGPLPEMAATAFSPHMILHLGVVGIAAPLIALAVVARSGQALAGLGMPLVLGVAATEMIVVWGWHLPALHAGAARSQALFVVQQVSFLAAATLVWTVSFAGRDRRDAAVGSLVMGATFAHMSMLGLAFVLAQRPLYPLDVCRGAFGFDPLGDQQFGGALMAVFGGFPYLVGAMVLGLRMLRPQAPAGR